MKIFQQQIQLKKKRGFHLVIAEVVHALPQLNEIRTVICQVSFNILLHH